MVPIQKELVLLSLLNNEVFVAARFTCPRQLRRTAGVSSFLCPTTAASFSVPFGFYLSNVKNRGLFDVRCETSLRCVSPLVTVSDACRVWGFHLLRQRFTVKSSLSPPKDGSVCSHSSPVANTLLKGTTVRFQCIFLASLLPLVSSLQEIQWVNSYHQNVWTNVAPRLQNELHHTPPAPVSLSEDATVTVTPPTAEQTLRWLQAATSPLPLH